MTLPYDDVGSGPAVVLLHAGVADRGMWAEHLEPVARAGYRVVAVDLPGFGEAPVGDGADAPWADVLQTMDALGIDSAALIGNSFGWAVALRAAVTAPSRFWALVLISAPAPGLSPSPQLQAAWEAEESALEHGDVEGAVDAVVSEWTLPASDASVRERVGAMQRRAYALQANAGPGMKPPILSRRTGTRCGRSRSPHSWRRAPATCRISETERSCWPMRCLARAMS